jgi:hypothetical protein
VDASSAVAEAAQRAADTSGNYRALLDAVRRRVERSGVRGLDAESIAHDLMVKRTLLPMLRDGSGPTALEIGHAVADWRRTEARRRAAEAHTAQAHATVADDRTEDPLMRNLERVALRALTESLRAVHRAFSAASLAGFARSVYGVSSEVLAVDLGGSARTWRRRNAEVLRRLELELRRWRVERDTVVSLPGSLCLLRKVLIRWACHRQRH